MIDCALQHLLNTEGAGTLDMARKKDEPRQSRPGKTIITTVIINNREATSTKGARAILKEITGNDYSRDAVYRLFLTGKIEGERSDIANFYYVDSVRKAAQGLILPATHKKVGRKPEQKRYPPEMREQAFALKDQGMSNRQIALQLHISFQTVNNWIKHRP